MNHPVKPAIGEFVVAFFLTHLRNKMTQGGKKVIEIEVLCKKLTIFLQN